MITKDNFQNLLAYLGYTSDLNQVFSKSFGTFSLQVDWNTKKLIYPEHEGLIVHERQICTFSAPENFVVFECVHRLLAKGYDPKSIELEPKWKLGHGASGGRADILVKNRTEKTLLLIECKTAGKEFKKEQENMLKNGGQLFSYLQQDKNTRYLCLYTSDFTNAITYQSAIVKIQDRQEDIDAYEQGHKGVKLFRYANNKTELYEVWKDTFNLYFHYNGIFEEDINAYEIELKPLKAKNLRPLKEAKNVFNTFMEILRHNNISDNANAYNRILSLLLCKIVDENKSGDAILDFQVKEGGDTPEKIQDRLQKLYAEGMEAYLRQNIVYFEDKAITDIIKLYPRQTPIEAVEDMFKQIKYYTHNEFAFKEVHNKELFLQNARVLNEVIKMLQNYRFRYNKKEQILGDFFELLINHGIKQSEGQFFTPIPIVRFMIQSIGLDKIIKEKLDNNEKEFLPKILDYACGAGHFLTESIDELQQYIEDLSITSYTAHEQQDIQRNVKRYKESVEWARDYIFGVEKDYRLARTSQIACFLNGDGDANIIYGDGLENHPELHLKKKFDVVISNPPYSISSFKNYLSVGENEYSLFKYLTDKSGAIETLFIERTKQVLKEGGKAAIILPSSILSGSGVYENVREMLLAYFEIKAMAELGGQTFGATGTNTIILFLKRRSDDFQKDREYISYDLFNGVERKRKLEHIDSNALLRKYINHQDVNYDDYKTLMQKDPNPNMKQTDLWKNYRSTFSTLFENKRDEFYKKILTKEKEKFYLFMLTLDDRHKPQNTVIVKSGVKDVEKQFLGYKFSKRKGNEGIEIYRDEHGRRTTKMYDDDNHYNTQKANSYILKNIWNESIDHIDDSLKEHIQVAHLTNMLDFDRADFNKTISLHPKENFNIISKWQVVNLGDVVHKPQYGYTAKSDDSGEIRYLRITDITENGKLINHDKKYINPSNQIKTQYLLHNKDIVIARSGSVGRMFIYKNIEEPLIFASYLIRIKTFNNILPEYIFYYHNSNYYWQQVHSLKSVLSQPNLNAERMKGIKIPVPPINIQQKIVKACEGVDKEVEQAAKDIINYQKEIEGKIKNIIDEGYEGKKLGEIVKTIESGNRPEGGVGSIISGVLSLGGEHIHNSNGRIILEKPKYVSLDFYEQSQKGMVAKNDILICKDGALTGKIALLGNELNERKAMINEHVFLMRCKNEITQKYVFQYLYSKYGQNALKKNITGLAQGGLNRPNLMNIIIPFPSIAIQEMLVNEISAIEQDINRVQDIIDTAKKRKQAILDEEL